MWTSIFTWHPYESLPSGEMDGTAFFNPCERGKRAVLLQMGKDTAWAGSFWCMAKKMQTKQGETKATASISPLLLRALLPSVKADTWSHHSPVTAPHGAKLLCCRMPESLLEMLQMETGVLFTTGGLLFIGLGKVIMWAVGHSAVVLRTPASCRNYVLFEIEADRQIRT